MKFGQALIAMGNDDRVARKGWNGKGMFIFRMSGTQFEFDEIYSSEFKKHITPETTGRTDVVIHPYIAMRTADGTIVCGWLASQTDMLADDWEIV